MLTPLQRQIALTIGELPEAGEFALAGGAALIARGDIERMTRDLDYFGPSTVHVNRIVPAAEKALKDAGFKVRRILDGKGFVRLEVASTNDVTEVDFGADFRLLPAERGPLGRFLLGRSSP